MNKGKGYYNRTNFHRQKISEGLRGLKKSVEHKERIKKAVQKSWQLRT